MKKNSKIPVNSPTPSEGRVKSTQDNKKQPVKPLTTTQVPTDTKRIPAPARTTAATQKVPQKKPTDAVTPTPTAKKGSAPKAAPAKRAPATPGQAAKPTPARAADIPNKPTTPPTGKLSDQQPPEETDGIDGGNDGTSQPPKKPSNKISWKKVGITVLRFYFCLCLP